MNKVTIRLATVHYTLLDMTLSDFRNHKTTVGLLQGGISCRLCGQVTESAKHIILGSDLWSLIERRGTKQRGEDVDAGLG